MIARRQFMKVSAVWCTAPTFGNLVIQNTLLRQVTR